MNDDCQVLLGGMREHRNVMPAGVNFGSEFFDMPLDKHRFRGIRKSGMYIVTCISNAKDCESFQGSSLLGGALEKA